MNFVVGFIFSVAMSLINLPFVLQEGGSMNNLISMIFWGAMAILMLVMVSSTIGR